MALFSLKCSDLNGLDELQVESIALFCWSDSRPLHGTAGFLDWRLCGALSRTLLANQFVGDLNESLLMPIHGQPFLRRVFVFGLGTSKNYTKPVAEEAWRKAYASLKKAGVGSVCVGLPSLRGSPSRALDFFDILARGWADSIEVILAEPSIANSVPNVSR